MTRDGAFQVRPSRVGSRILGIGAYRPERVVPNAEIVDLIDSSDEWIRSRSGIVERRYAAPDETVADMAVEAAGKALAHAGVPASSVDVVLLATITHPYATPSASAEVADRLGTGGAAATDLGAACAGFCYAVGLADSLIRTGTADHVLVIGVEKMTDITDPRDRGTAFIFADGAGAVVLGASDTADVGPVVWGSDGAQRDTIQMTQTWAEYLREPAGVHPTLRMQGQAVYRWAVREIGGVCTQAMAAAGVTVDELDAFVPHQANLRITDALVKSLGLPDHVVVARDIETTGNTSGASIPLALDALVSSGAVKSGDVVLLAGFGAGLAHAAQVVRVP